MLFNSFPFFFVFLPLALIGYFLLSKVSIRVSIVFLMLASIGFYGYWNPVFLPILFVSVVSNFYLGRGIAAAKILANGGIDAKGANADGNAHAHNRRAKRLLLLGLVFNLSLLVFFKYADFVLANLAWMSGLKIAPLGIALPIGISFFTFTQIAYLVDCHAALVRETKPENYGLFVTYFPHLIAGPILHHKDMMPQFDQADSHVARRGRIVLGLLFFTLGLFKKVILADGVARFVAPVFDLNHASLSMLEAWCGALSYTFQLYFDFSAYSDMAYGLSYMFGIILPINFNSPYQSTSIIEFWRRWHITLSTFLRDYLYIPLGGNRRGPTARQLNLFITMVLGGLWHGANWTFVAWGALHGAYLMLNHWLRNLTGGQGGKLWAAGGWLLTFVAVVAGWVLFRANSIGIAFDVLQAMCHGTASGGAMNRIMAVDECLLWLLPCAAVAFLLPNLYRVLGRGNQPALEARLHGALGGLVLGLLLGMICLLLAIGESRGVSEFLYFNF
jgi:D-alanyl-lipoteichoic acid acyltransferase DltB (MBOAT superfamily)